jgi:hypothetical protein
VATKAADNGGGRAAAVEKNGFCVFSIFMSKKEAVCPDGRIVPAVFRVSVSMYLLLQQSYFLQTDFFFSTYCFSVFAQKRNEKRDSFTKARRVSSGRSPYRIVLWLVQINFTTPPSTLLFLASLLREFNGFCQNNITNPLVGVKSFSRPSSPLSDVVIHCVTWSSLLEPTHQYFREGSI